MKEKLLINFDCVSDGDTFLLGITKQANQKYHVPLAQVFTSTEDKAVLMENLKKVYYPSDQAGFPYAIAVAALKHKRFLGYYLDRIHTKRDIICREENIEFHLVTDQIHEDVRRIVMALPESQREVLVMRYYRDMSFKEIADATNVSINTALGRMRYAILNMRRIAEENNIVLTL
jgi:RNA polymerase sigma factor (sigma-70 family)